MSQSVEVDPLAKLVGSVRNGIRNLKSLLQKPKEEAIRVSRLETPEAVATMRLLATDVEGLKQQLEGMQNAEEIFRFFQQTNPHLSDGSLMQTRLLNECNTVLVKYEKKIIRASWTGDDFFILAPLNPKPNHSAFGHRKI